MVKSRKSSRKGTRARATRNATSTGYPVVDRFLNGITKGQRHAIARALEVRSLERVYWSTDFIPPPRVSQLASNEDVMMAPCWCLN